MDQSVENTSIETEAQADEVLSSLESPSGGPIQEKPQETQSVADEFELTVGGKAIKAKRDQVMQWAQMGYDAPNKIRTLSKELETWKQKWSETEPKWKELETKYGEVDSYVRQNPKFWDHVLQSYQNQNQALQDDSNPLAQTVAQLQSKLDGLIQYKDQVEQERVQARARQEDEQYSQTLEAMRKSYPDVDFTTPDEMGKSLEYKVIEHAQANGIRDFKTAFRDYYHDELVKRAEAKAKESILKEKQKNTKLGILGITPTPVKRTSTENIREKSYDDLAAEALVELGIR